MTGDRSVARRRIGAAFAGAIVLACVLVSCGQSGPVVLSAATDRHVVRLTVDPARAGSSTWLIEVSDSHGQPVSAERVLVEPAMPQMGHAIPPMVAVPEAPGRYRLAEAMLPMPGRWELTVTIVLDGGVEDRSVFPVLVTG